MWFTKDVIFLHRKNLKPQRRLFRNSKEAPQNNRKEESLLGETSAVVNLNGFYCTVYSALTVTVIEHSVRFP